ncbi:hypothetical protein [Sphingomonas abaci]|uniref:Uncharacterized protein n=1 Tax=Sphingomonas abaci TaxID=237611 RepID=A0A7W7AKG7_9SPHN|nr:hypothetical protein [Sphingomonas abaci]MBB4618684.1 hypothetical protein [Sphingomonas abaci]
MSEVYPTLKLPVPRAGEWIDFFVAPMKARFCLYWRINDGDRDDPDTVQFGFISAHKSDSAAREKMRWLTGEYARQGRAA